MRIAFATSYIPSADGGGSSIRSYGIISRLAKKHSLHLFALSTNTEKDRQNICHLKNLGVIVNSAPLVIKEGITKGEKIKGLCTSQPYMAQAFGNLRTKIAFQDFLSSTQPELIHIDLLRMAWCIPFASKATPTILDTHNVESQRFLSQMNYKELSPIKRLLSLWEYVRLYQFEAYSYRQATWVVSVTPEDATRIKNISQHKSVTYIPVGIDTNYFQPQTRSIEPTLIFAGSMFYDPNVDAVLYFYKQVLPLITKIIPNIKIFIVGHDPAKEVMQLAKDPRVQVTGSVTDVRPYFSQSTVSVIPVRIGGGIKQKVLEAMAMGMPVVTTSFSCIGISVRDEEHLLVRDTPEAFADAVVKLLRNQKRRVEIGVAAAKFVRSNYSWEKTVSEFEEIYSQAIKSYPNKR